MTAQRVGGGIATVARLAAEAAGASIAIVAPAQDAATIAPRVEEATTGTWRLLGMAVSDPDEIATCVATGSGPALDHDARLRTELVATFRAYLDHGANMNATASAIYAHRHTVAARLERLGALTGLDPTRHEDRERLGVGPKAGAVLAASSSTISH